MDNITHTLIGIAAAETVACTRKKQDRVPLWVASAVANNLPDLDVLFTWGHDKVHYLLHHRGFTHTFLLAPLQGMLMLAILRLLFWRRSDYPWKPVVLLTLLGPFLHVFADSWNTYGVHPFWPVNNEWFYGDFVFIVEPWLWAALLPPIFWRAQSRIGMGLALALMALLLGLIWWQPLVIWPVALALSLFLALWLAAQWRIAGDQARVLATLICFFVPFSAFAISKTALEKRFREAGQETAFLAQPGNPLCWTVLRAGFQGEGYRAAAWSASAWPSLVPASSCPALYKMDNPELFSPLEGGAAEAGQIPIAEFRGTLSDFQRIGQSCRARALLQFSRIPVWKLEKEVFWLGDLRFFRIGKGPGFSEFTGRIGEDDCPPFPAPWVGRFSKMLEPAK